MASVLLLAYPYNARDQLNFVPEEIKALQKRGGAANLIAVPVPTATQDDIEINFSQMGRQAGILIFHYAGHAKGSYLELNAPEMEDEEAMYFVDMKYLAPMIVRDARGLKLVFLNGCATDEQAQYLREAGVPAVISTTIPISDPYAHRFALKFYDKFFNEEKTLEQAFEDALASMSAGHPQWKDTETNTNQQRSFIHHKLRDINLDAWPLEDMRHAYTLNASQETKAQRLEDWITDTPKPNLNVDTENNNLPLRRHPDSYLLCNRESEEGDFKEKLSNNSDSNPEGDVQFILINSNTSDCPLELINRFNQFTLRRHGLPFFPGLIDFPAPNDFDIASDPNKPLRRLKQNFDEFALDFSREKTHSNKFSKEYILIPSHYLSPKNEDWREGIKALFEYYIGPYSTEIKARLCEHIIVICILEYNNHPGTQEAAQQYKKLFASLQQKYPGRITHWDDLKPIYNHDLKKWHFRVFNEDLGQPLLSEEGEPFVRVKELMKAIITGQNGIPAKETS